MWRSAANDHAAGRRREKEREDERKPISLPLNFRGNCVFDVMGSALLHPPDERVMMIVF